MQTPVVKLLWLVDSRISSFHGPIGALTCPQAGAVAVAFLAIATYGL